MKKIINNAIILLVKTYYKLKDVIMTIKKAKLNDFENIKYIVETTINTVYPKYYPSGAVDFFLKHHSDENIKMSIEADEVYLFYDNNTIIGTGTINRNDIDRLFILPEFQGKGYGTKALDYIENEIFNKYEDVVLSASFPAFEMYRKRGYVTFEYNKLLTDNGDYLCFFNMRLKKS